jgi:hypothetical protein
MWWNGSRESAGKEPPYVDGALAGRAVWRAAALGSSPGGAIKAAAGVLMLPLRAARPLEARAPGRAPRPCMQRTRRADDGEGEAVGGGRQQGRHPEVPQLDGAPVTGRGAASGGNRQPSASRGLAVKGQ